MNQRETILACTHPDKANETSLRDADGNPARCCCDCWNASVAAYRADRRAQLAARPKDCARCAARPHQWILGGYPLCGRCKTAVLAERDRIRGVALFAGVPINTSGWKGLRP